MGRALTRVSSPKSRRRTPSAGRLGLRHGFHAVALYALSRWQHSSAAMWKREGTKQRLCVNCERIPSLRAECHDPTAFELAFLGASDFQHRNM